MEVNNFANISSNWEYVLPPSRPSTEELIRIQTILCNIDRECPIAVLGSTIEFRNLLHELNFQNITIFEKNKDFYEWTKCWIAYDTDNENVVWGDWLDTIGEYKNHFMMILSDLTMGNIPYDKRSHFYEKIYNALLPEGYFVDKVLMNDIPLISLKQILEQYECLPINLLTVNRFSCEALFCSELLKEGIIDTSKFYLKLYSEFANSKKMLKFLEKCHLITPEKCVWYYGKPWNEVKIEYQQPYKKCLVFEDVMDSPYYGRSKQLINIK